MYLYLEKNVSVHVIFVFLLLIGCEWISHKAPRKELWDKDVTRTIVCSRSFILPMWDCVLWLEWPTISSSIPSCTSMNFQCTRYLGITYTSEGHTSLTNNPWRSNWQAKAGILRSAKNLEAYAFFWLIATQYKWSLATDSPNFGSIFHYFVWTVCIKCDHIQVSSHGTVSISRERSSFLARVAQELDNVVFTWLKRFWNETLENMTLISVDLQ